MSGGCAVGSSIRAIAADATVTFGNFDPVPATRFEACADGLTLADHDTELFWKKKTGTGG